MKQLTDLFRIKYCFIGIDLLMIPGVSNKFWKKVFLLKVIRILVTSLMIVFCVCACCLPTFALSAQPISPSLYPNDGSSSMYSDLYSQRIFTPFTLWITDRNQVDNVINDNFAYSVYFDTVLNDSYFFSAPSADFDRTDNTTEWVNTYNIELEGFQGASTSEPWYKGFYRIRPTNTLAQTDNYGFNSSQYFIHSGGYVFRPSDIETYNNVSYLRFNENLDDSTRGLVTSVVCVDTVQYFRAGVVVNRTSTHTYNIDYDKVVIDIPVFSTEMIDVRGNTDVYILNTTRQITVYNNGNVFENVSDPYVFVCGANSSNNYVSGFDFFNNDNNYGNTDVSSAFFEGYQMGLIDGESSGYSKGFDEGYNDAIVNLDFTSWLGHSVSGFMDFPIFSNITIGGILYVCIALGLVLAFLKVFAGG